MSWLAENKSATILIIDKLLTSFYEQKSQRLSRDDVMLFFLSF